MTTQPPRPGREGVADISRLCRAILTEWTIAEDPNRSPVIGGLFDEARLNHPGRSVQMMAAIAVTLSRRLRTAMAIKGVHADQLLQDTRRHRKRIGDTPEMVDACMDIMDTLAAETRDQAALTRQLQHATGSFGAYTLAFLTSVALKFATDIVTYSDGKYEDELGVFGEMFAADEADLASRGEA